MTNELAVIDTMSFDDLAKLSGQSAYDNTSRSTLPWVTVNKDAETDDGKAVPVGSLTVELPEFGRVYTKKAIFRPFVRGFQYRKYDPKEEKTTSRSKIIQQWTEEAFDTTGTIKCGKPKVKKGEFMTPEQETLAKMIKCYMMIFGVISFEGVDTEGKAVTVKDAPVGLRARGLSYMALDEVFTAMSKKRRPMMYTELTLTLKRGKNGSNVFYTIDPSLDWTAQPIWRADEDTPIFRDFLDYIKVVNESIYEEYKKLVGKRATPEDGQIVESVGHSKSLKDDFKDDLDDAEPVSNILMAG